MNLFLENLKTALENKSLEAEKFTYFDYTAEESKLIDENKNFFAEMLQDFEAASEITSDAKNAAEKINICDTPLNLKLIENYCNKNKITPATLCLAVLGYVIARYTASNKIYLTTISSGRANVKYADTFGMFVNTLPLKIELADVLIKNFVENVSEMFNETISHENYPFAQIAEDYNLAPKIMYEYQRGVVENFDIPKFSDVETFARQNSKFKLTVRIIDKNNLPVRKISLIDDEHAEILKKFHSNTNPATIDKVYTTRPQV